MEDFHRGSTQQVDNAHTLDKLARIVIVTGKLEILFRFDLYIKTSDRIR